jgi:hypothetical protein
MTAPTPTNFVLDTSDYLSINYSEFRDDMLAMALGKPAAYFELRKVVLKAVKAEAIKTVYTQYYNLLTVGKDAAGNKIGPDTWIPNYPKQLVSQFALGAAKTMDKIAEDAIEILMPRNLQAIANEKTSIKGKADVIGL